MELPKTGPSENQTFSFGPEFFNGKKKRIKGQTTINKTLHIILKIEQHEPHFIRLNRQLGLMFGVSLNQINCISLFLSFSYYFTKHHGSKQKFIILKLVVSHKLYFII